VRPFIISLAKALIAAEGVIFHVISVVPKSGISPGDLLANLCSIAMLAIFVTFDSFARATELVLDGMEAVFNG
jgi:hypothetical protein